MQAQLRRVFTPGAPVGSLELLAGRQLQIREALRAVSQQGYHAIIYGERGVGKTSLARFIHQIWSDVAKEIDMVIAPRINCDSTDDFSSIWAKVSEEIQLIFEKRGTDWQALPDSGAFSTAIAELEVGNATPGLVRRALDLPNHRFIVVIDEFDRLEEDSDTTRMFADTIKMLSDQLVDATLILVGVADNVDGLIREHASIDRSVVQILMPRMTPTELSQIVHNGLRAVGMTIEDDALGRITTLSKGLPHYTHLLGLHSALQATTNQRDRVSKQDVYEGLRDALDTMKETIGNSYYEATRSPHKDARYGEVLLACALTEVDELGYFSPGNVRGPLSEIRGEFQDIPSFMRHLREFCEERRGQVLARSKQEVRPRYRFRNPLMQPYVLLRGVDEGRLNETLLQRAFGL